MFTPPPGNAFAAGASPRFVAVGDFNGDQISDVAMVNPYSGTVTVMLGTLAGALVAPVNPTTKMAYPSFTFPAGSMPTSVAAGYFKSTAPGSASTTLDLAVTSISNTTTGQGAVTILIGDGVTGNFTSGTPATPPVNVGKEPVAIAVSDFDQDGIPDLAVANAGDGTVTILFGAGDGTFSTASNMCTTISPAPVGSGFPVGSRPVAIAAGNFGGFPGMAVANQLDGTVTVLSIVPNGQGSCTVVTQGPFPVLPGFINPPYPYPSGIAVADVNLDGYPDIITANDGTDNISVLLGDGRGGFLFAAGSPIAVGASPVGVAAADFNGDGYPDLAVANYGSGNVSVLLGSATGFTSASGSPFASGASPASVAVGDFDGQSKPSLAAANESDNTVTILLNGTTLPMSVVSGASFTSPVSGGSVISISGAGLATSPMTTPQGSVPAMFDLDGTSVTITYSNAMQDVLPLYMVSATQVSAAISTSSTVTPVPGLAALSVVTPTKTHTSLVEIAPYAPALFSANQNGTGVALATFAEGTITGNPSTPTYQCSAATPCTGTNPCPAATPCGPVALNLSNGGGTLMLNATGLAGLTSVTVTVGGMAPVPVMPTPLTNMPGMYTLSVQLPQNTKVRGTVPITLSVTPTQCAGTLATPSVPCPAVVSNVVTVLIQ
jgi:uncharacterized protein (TIGR03437 family)